MVELIDVLMNIWMDRQIHEWMYNEHEYGQTEEQMDDGWINSQLDGWMDRQIDR